MNLSIGMATYKDFDALYFTVQHIRAFHLEEGDEILVIDNYGCDTTRDFCEKTKVVRYIRDTSVQGTSAPRERVFEEATHEYVICVDSHVLFLPGAIAAVRKYYEEHPDTVDLIQGPLYWDELEPNVYASHFTWEWGKQMFGTWAKDDRAEDVSAPAFEIPNMGLGTFSCRKSVWPGFHPNFRGFGGEEGYLHEKFRRRGGKALCLPAYRWVHKFFRPEGVPYNLTLDDKFRNHLLGWEELGLDMTSVVEHFIEWLPVDSATYWLWDVLKLVDRSHHYDRLEIERLGGIRKDQVPASSLFASDDSSDKVLCFLTLNDESDLDEYRLQRSVASFLEQTYANAILLIINNVPGHTVHTYAARTRVITPASRLGTVESIGRLVMTTATADFIVTWPLNGESRSDRLEELLKEIKESSADAVEEVDGNGQPLESFSGIMTHKSFQTMVQPITSESLLADDSFVVAEMPQALIHEPGTIQNDATTRPPAPIWVKENSNQR